MWMWISPEIIRTWIWMISQRLRKSQSEMDTSPMTSYMNPKQGREQEEATTTTNLNYNNKQANSHTSCATSRYDQDDLMKLRKRHSSGWTHSMTWILEKGRAGSYTHSDQQQSSTPYGYGIQNSQHFHKSWSSLGGPRSKPYQQAFCWTFFVLLERMNRWNIANFAGVARSWSLTLTSRRLRVSSLVVQAVMYDMWLPKFPSGALLESGVWGSPPNYTACCVVVSRNGKFSELLVGLKVYSHDLLRDFQGWRKACTLLLPRWCLSTNGLAIAYHDA